MKIFNILAIETTCDETAIAILSVKNGKAKILANVLLSQIKIHQPYGGVVPSLAKREHQKNLIPLLIEAMKEAKLLKKKKKILNSKKKKNIEKILKRDESLREKTLYFLENYQKPEIDLISVAYGPGLEPAIWTSINLVKALGYFFNIPIERINHIEAHILSNWISNSMPKKNDFPIISLTVSGGHTQLVLMKEIGKYKIIGETRDDAAGECFDKTARLLGLGYPGGPVISQYAEKYISKKRKDKIEIQLPRPMIHSKDFDFSFSGLKTAALYLIEKLKKKKINIKKITPKIAFEIQEAISETLISKTISAAKKYKAKTIILAGGVSANKRLREKMKEEIKKELPKVKFFLPEIKYSTDNAVMIAITSFLHKKYKIGKKIKWQYLRANSNARVG
jgi:N6-L-threonylcarbamoyladenine synthase